MARRHAPTVRRTRQTYRIQTPRASPFLRTGEISRRSDSPDSSCHSRRCSSPPSGPRTPRPVWNRRSRNLPFHAETSGPLDDLLPTLVVEVHRPVVHPVGALFGEGVTCHHAQLSDRIAAHISAAVPSQCRATSDKRRTPSHRGVSPPSPHCPASPASPHRRPATPQSAPSRSQRTTARARCS